MQVIILSALLGCVSSGGGLYPIHARPAIPPAVQAPEEAFIVCGDDYFCITPEDVESLRVFILKMSNLVDKYEYAIVQINASQ